jgi:hypothetical protein
MSFSSHFGVTEDDVISKRAAYPLVYWGDGEPSIGTVGSYIFPEGYKIGFMVRANTTADGKKKQGELYGDGRLNNYINNFGNFKSSNLGYDGPRMGWITVNTKMYACVESGTDSDFNDIILEVEKFQNEDRSIPVFFAGAYYTDLNDSCLLGESIGRSMFAWDTETEPLGYFSSRRCINYIGLFGYKYNYVEDVTGLYEKCSALPSYPNPGYVSGENGVIMVNLGDKKDLNR